MLKLDVFEVIFLKKDNHKIQHKNFRNKSIFTEALVLKALMILKHKFTYKIGA